MPRYVDEDDRWDSDDEQERWQAEEDEDAELPDGVYPGDEEEPTVSCPHCHQEMLEDSPYCPHCETYISQEDAPPHAKPWWIIIGTLLALLVVYLWIVGH